MIHILLALVLASSFDAPSTSIDARAAKSADSKPVGKPSDTKNPVAQADTAKVKVAVVDLDKAFKDGDKTERVKAIGANAVIVDAEVIERIAKGLRDKENDVVKAAIEALRFMDHPEAVRALNECAKRDAKIRKDAESYAALLRAIGQHGDATSIDVLTDDIWTTLDADVIQARLLGLGRIRTTAAVDKLFDLLKSAGPSKVQPYMEHFRVSLMVLTGADEGASQEAWLRWWNDNKSKVKVDAKPRALPKHLQYLWDAYWGETLANERPQKKSERGQDDPEK